MEELHELQEELVSARAEAERLEEQLADREARLLAQSEQLAALRHDLESTRTSAAEHNRALTERYRSALVEAAPDVPPELIQGTTVEELDRSLVAARDLVARVTSRVQAGVRIPAGSPARSAPSYEGLSPGELIRAGIQQA